MVFAAQLRGRKTLVIGNKWALSWQSKNTPYVRTYFWTPWFFFFFISFSPPRRRLFTSSTSQERGIIYWSASSVWTEQTEATPTLWKNTVIFDSDVFSKGGILTFRASISSLKRSEDARDDARSSCCFSTRSQVPSARTNWAFNF